MVFLLTSCPGPHIIPPHSLSTTMPLTNVERAFMLKAISAGIRVDERRPFDFRPAHFTFDPAQRGLLTVRLGEGERGQRDTVVTAMVTASVVRPFPDRPAEGSVVYHVALSSTSVQDLRYCVA